MLLRLEELEKSIGDRVLFRGVSFVLRAGDRIGVVGPNGAGKSTLLNCISRLYTPDAGSIRYEGRDLLRVDAHGLARFGICRTFQNLELFRDVSARENVAMGAAFRFRPNAFVDTLALPRARRASADAAARAATILAELGLDEVADAIVRGLPYGTQKSIELARALATEPRLMLLDEPAAGMNPEETRRLGATIRALRDQRGLTILLVEHDMRLVMSTCDRIVVLDHGEKICEGTPQVVRQDPAVIRAYLGEEDALA